MPGGSSANTSLACSSLSPLSSNSCSVSHTKSAAVAEVPAPVPVIVVAQQAASVVSLLTVVSLALTAASLVPLTADVVVLLLLFSLQLSRPLVITCCFVTSFCLWNFVTVSLRPSLFVKLPSSLSMTAPFSMSRFAVFFTPLTWGLLRNRLLFVLGGEQASASEALPLLSLLFILFALAGGSSLGALRRDLLWGVVTTSSSNSPFLLSRLFLLLQLLLVFALLPPSSLIFPIFIEDPSTPFFSDVASSASLSLLFPSC